MTDTLQIIEEISANPIAVKMSYPDRLPAKVEKLHEFFPDFTADLVPFIEVVLSNTAMKPNHIENALKFLRKLEPDETLRAASLFSLLWPERDDKAIAVGLSEDKAARTDLMKQTAAKADTIREFVKGTPSDAWDVKLLGETARALQLDGAEVLRLVAIRPKILRGLRKPPRPKFAWIPPAALAFAVMVILLFAFPRMPLWSLYAIMISIQVVGTCVISMRLPIAPGILYYEKTQNRLQQILRDEWTPSPVVGRMQDVGIDTDAYLKARQYNNGDTGVRIEIRDKRTLDGAMQFLTSSEEIGNCIALRNFVAWSLPSLLDDETIMLADVYSKGSTRGWHQRAQLWMVAAERDGQPMLTVNSVEFNNEGAKHQDVLLPEMVNVLQDVAQRSGFKGIQVGISDFGREWFDEHYSQAEAGAAIRKVHDESLGYLYYFDSYRLGRDGGKKVWQYMRRRTVTVRLYAVVFGLLELLKGNQGKAAAFWDSARNTNNAWEVPIKKRSD